MNYFRVQIEPLGANVSGYAVRCLKNLILGVIVRYLILSLMTFLANVFRVKKRKGLKRLQIVRSDENKHYATV